MADTGPSQDGEQHIGNDASHCQFPQDEITTVGKHYSHTPTIAKNSSDNRGDAGIDSLPSGVLVNVDSHQRIIFAARRSISQQEKLGTVGESADPCKGFLERHVPGMPVDPAAGRAYVSRFATDRLVRPAGKGAKSKRCAAIGFVSTCRAYAGPANCRVAWTCRDVRSRYCGRL